MLKAGGGGSLLFSGATAAVRGGAKFAAFAPSKFALRGLSQSLAREFGPQGVHVAHIILDGLIDTERVRGMMGEGKEGSVRRQSIFSSFHASWLLTPANVCSSAEAGSGQYRQILRAPGRTRPQRLDSGARPATICRKLLMEGKLDQHATIGIECTQCFDDRSESCKTPPLSHKIVE